MQDLVRFGCILPATSVCDPSKFSKLLVLCTQLDARRVQPGERTVGNEHRFFAQLFVNFAQGIDDEAL